MRKETLKGAHARPAASEEREAGGLKFAWGGLAGALSEMRQARNSSRAKQCMPGTGASPVRMPALQKIPWDPGEAINFKFLRAWSLPLLSMRLRECIRRAGDGKSMKKLPPSPPPKKKGKVQEKRPSESA